MIWASSVILLMSVLGATRFIWWFSWLDFPRLHYICLGLIFGIIACFTLDFLSVLINVFTIGFSAYRIRHFFPKLSRKVQIQNRQVMSINAFDYNINLEALDATLSNADPELILIMEMTDKTETALADFLKNYTYRIETPVRDGFRICLLSKRELLDREIIIDGPGDTPIMHAKIIINGEKCHVFCAHPKPALSKQWYNDRAEYFDQVVSIVKRSDLPVLVLGDFNAVPWEEQFQRFLSRANLKSTLEGYGYKVTWPAFIPIFGVPMDHILVSIDHPYSDLHVGPYAGSDHYPISINLEH